MAACRIQLGLVAFCSALWLVDGTKEMVVEVSSFCQEAALGCGYAIELTEDNPVIISSPNFPNNYGNYLQCFW